MAGDNNELAVFVLRRGQVKAQLTRFQTFLIDPKSNNLTQLRLRAEKIRETWSEFDAIQNNIEILDESNNDQLQYRSTFEDLYFDLMSEVDKRLSRNNAPAQSQQQIQGDQSVVKNNQDFPLIKPHNSLLHQDKEPRSEEQSTQDNASNDALVVAHTVDAADTDNQVLLATAISKLSSSAGRYIHGRALLDNGSQSNFITSNMVHKLGLKRQNVNIPICGISESKNNIKHKVTAVVQSLYSPYETIIEFLVLSKITGSLPQTPIHTISIPDNVNVADPSFNCPGNIDVLIGSDTYWDIICDEKFKIKDGPYLQKTLFGWVVVGKTSTDLSTRKLNSCLLTTQNQYQLLDNKIELFWKMEELSSKHNFTDEEKSCITHFNENLAQNENGRFIVKLPFKENRHHLGNSFSSALRRFLSLEKRLVKNPELYTKYKMFMSEYESLNHMERICDTGGDKQLIDRTKCFYLPHSYVINDRSRTTKLRVVFDGSAKISSGVSLNDILMNGPKIQPDLFEIVVRLEHINMHFRQT